MADESRPPRTTRTYAKRLFNNFYNYMLLGGAAATAAVSGDWWILLAAGAAEALFMLYAPDSPPVRHLLDKAIDREEADAAKKRRETAIAALTRGEQVRCMALLTKRAQIAKLAAENPTFGGELVRVEIRKLDRLVDSFVELASTSARYSEYLDREDIAEVERLARAYEKEAAGAQEHARDLAKKNLEIVMRRLERLREIRSFCDRAGGQLDLIENSFGLLADQIVSMRSPQELAGQLDDLIDGVEAVRQTAREADRLLVSEAR